jgi:sugar lactone lactonase YvrE
VRAVLLRCVSLPTSHITTICFGGAGLGRLFGSSDWAGLTADQRAAQPLADAVFEADPQGVKGLPGLPALG